jgi:hypothetical protein
MFGYLSAFGGEADMDPGVAPSASVANAPRRKSRCQFCCDAQQLIHDVLGWVDEATRVHHADWRCGGGVAAGGAPGVVTD